jgi:tRNA-2-methylthio-N6-dimethylallyladenosine synthase
MAITTDIIVGFPGETEEDFQDTLDLMDLVQFDNSYSFVFSPRPGTVAAELKETLTHQEKLARLQILQAKQQEIMTRRLAAWVGRTAEVLIDNLNLNDESFFGGRISQNLTVKFQQPHESIKLGTTVNARITGHNRVTLTAELVAA